MYRIRAIKDTTYIPNLQKANQTQGKDAACPDFLCDANNTFV